jgi:hypothetical protein
MFPMKPKLWGPLVISAVGCRAWRHDIQNDDTQHNDILSNDTQHNDTQHNHFLNNNIKALTTLKVPLYKTFLSVVNEFL